MGNRKVQTLHGHVTGELLYGIGSTNIRDAAIPRPDDQRWPPGGEMSRIEAILCEAGARIRVGFRV
jgi:hypothetical protein